MANKPVTPEEMKAYIDATWKKWQTEAWQEPRQWQGLTEDEKNAMVEWAHPDIIEAIELKLKGRNT